jgi:hypothetical protein
MSADQEEGSPAGEPEPPDDGRQLPRATARELRNLASYAQEGSYWTPLSQAAARRPVTRIMEIMHISDFTIVLPGLYNKISAPTILIPI